MFIYTFALTQCFLMYLLVCFRAHGFYPFTFHGAFCITQIHFSFTINTKLSSVN